MVVETQRERLQWVGWRPELPEAGTYTVLLRCAAPESYQVDLKLDGKTGDRGPPCPPPAGGRCEHFRWVSLGHYLFRKGTNDVRLWARDHSYLPRLDKIPLRPHSALASRKWLGDAAKVHGLDKGILSQLQFVSATPGRPPSPIPSASSNVPDPVAPNSTTEIAKLQESEQPTLPRMLAVTDQADHRRRTRPPQRRRLQYVEKEPVPRGVPTLPRRSVPSPTIPEQPADASSSPNGSPIRGIPSPPASSPTASGRDTSGPGSWPLPATSGSRDARPPTRLS